jgi:glycosyltransferase involved in cell wall biosynthesis
MVKIAFITPMIPHYRLSFFDKLSTANKDYKFVVFYGTKKVRDGRPSYEGDTKFIKKAFRELMLIKSPLQIEFYSGMFSELKKFNPDIIIMDGIAGSITYRRIISWSKRERKKTVLWTCGWEPNRVNGILLTIKNRFVLSFFRKADFFLTYSTTANRYLESFGIDESIIKTCYNGIETDDLVKNYERIIERSKEIIVKYELSGYLTFLYVGGLLIDKKVPLLIEAFHELRKNKPKIKLLIIGDGPQKTLLEEKLKYYNDPNIYYLGRIINDVDPYFAASDCFVLPGVGGLALNQAMFWGKPCIVSKADGTEDDLVIENKTGYRFKDNDLMSLISAMEKRINESQKRISEMSINSKNLVLTRSNVNNMVNVFSKTVDKLII